MRESEVATRLLAWYDRQARVLPWRVSPADRRAGIRPDPYHVWLSEVMLQQTTVAAVTGYFQRFLSRWPNIEALARADDGEVMAAWAGLGYYARARNLLRCVREVAPRGGFPGDEAALARLPGIGPYTAAAIAAIAFDQPVAVVDGNVERVVARLFAVGEPLPGAKVRLRVLAASLTPNERPGDYAQAMMDLGATVCTPVHPDCAACPLAASCAARAQGLTEVLPRRLPRPERPQRYGLVYAARRRDGAWLLERRPSGGLLGGMLAFPTSAWVEEVGVEWPAAAAPLDGIWRDPGVEVRHTFSHFHLRLELRVAEPPPDAVPRRGSFMGAAGLLPQALPSVMRKAFVLAEAALAPADAQRSRPTIS